MAPAAIPITSRASSPSAPRPRQPRQPHLLPRRFALSFAVFIGLLLRLFFASHQVQLKSQVPQPGKDPVERGSILQPAGEDRALGVGVARGQSPQPLRPLFADPAFYANLHL